MKKVISLVLTALFIAAAFISAVPAGAEEYTGNLDFSLTNAAGVQSDEITLELNIDKNSGFWAFIIYIYYDSDIFILRDVTYNDQLLEVGDFMRSKNNVTADNMTGAAWDSALKRFQQFNIGTSDKEFKLIYFDMGDNGDSDFTGTVATLKFQIMGIAPDGDYEIGIMPSPGNAINDNSEDLLVSWKNARVHVGDNNVPKETEPVVNVTDTVAPEEMTEEPETKSREQIESEALAETDTKTTTAAPETIKGDDGIIYIINEEGETEVYEPDTDTPESADTDGDAESADTASAADTGDRSPEDDTETETEAATETDVAGEVKQEEESAVNLFGMKIPLVYFIAAVLLILIAIAAVLFVIISKTKKSDKELDEEQ